VSPSLQELVATRSALHRLAEHVLSAARHAVTGRIGLQPAPAGLRTPAFGDDERVLEVAGDRLLLRTAGRTGEHRITTLRAAGEFAGVPPGAPAQVYTPVTPCEPDASLVLDPAAVQVLADWWRTGAAALDALRAAAPGDAPGVPQLWPEHLDLALVAAGVNYGISPGDDAHPAPYAYVGPFGGPPDGDAFWNAPFGALRPAAALPTADDVAAFLLEGRARLRRGGT
jgi:hypothetical protein